MDDLESTCFLYGSVDGTAVGAVHRLSGKGVDCLREGLTG